MTWTMSLCSLDRLFWELSLNRCYVAGLEVSGFFPWTVCPRDLDDVIVLVCSCVLDSEFESLHSGWVGGVWGFRLDSVHT